MVNEGVDGGSSSVRQRPLGVVVVVVLGLGRVIIEAVQLATVDPHGVLGWIAGGSTIPDFESGTVAWYMGRAAILAIIALTATSVIGLWRFRTWGWSLALVLAGFVLALDIGWWLAGDPRYPGMFLNMIVVFYLNQRDVRAIYLPSSL